MVPAGFTPLHDFLDSMRQTDWFGHLGEDMSPVTTGVAETYLRSVKQTTTLIKIARSWDEAKAAANSAESRAAHSVDEERDRQFLREQAANIHSPELCTTWLNLAFESISNIAYGITTEIRPKTSEFRQYLIDKVETLLEKNFCELCLLLTIDFQSFLPIDFLYH